MPLSLSLSLCIHEIKYIDVFRSNDGDFEKRNLALFLYQVRLGTEFFFSY